MTACLAVALMIVIILALCRWVDWAERRHRHRQADRLADWHRYQHRTR